MTITETLYFNTREFVTVTVSFTAEFSLSYYEYEELALAYLRIYHEFAKFFLEQLRVRDNYVALILENARIYDEYDEFTLKYYRIYYENGSLYITIYIHGKSIHSHIRVGHLDVSVLTTAVRNVGAWFDYNLKMSTHINKICQFVYYHLHNIRQSRNYVIQDNTKLLMQAVIMTRIDYCNGPLYNVPAVHVSATTSSEYSSAFNYFHA